MFHNTQLCQLPLPLNFQHVPVRWEKLPAHHKSAAAKPSPADGNVSGDGGSALQALQAHSTPWLPAANLCGLEALSALTSKFVPEMGSVYWVWRSETSNTAQGSSGPRLLQLSTVNSVPKQLEKNCLGVFALFVSKVSDCEKVFIRQLLPWE